MNFPTYQIEQLRCETNDYEKVKNRITPEITRLLHGVIGLQTETGEIFDCLKKHLIYGKELDVTNMREELGDLMWYVSVILHSLNISFEQILDENISKLKTRYPVNFTEQAAMNRADKKED